MKTKLLVETWKNFLQENNDLENNKKQKVKEFLEFVKSKLPYIITKLDQFSLEFENSLGLDCIDGNHRLEIFKRIYSYLQYDENNKTIPSIIICENTPFYIDLINKSNYEFSIIKDISTISSKVNEQANKTIQKYIEKNKKIIFINELKIKDIPVGRNKPSPLVNQYIYDLCKEFFGDDSSNYEDLFIDKSYIKKSQYVDFDDFFL
jgi:hypothetical protein